VGTTKPIHTSTPIRNCSNKANTKTTPIKILNVNCQSIKSKQCRLKNLIDNTKPDVIICTETWVDPSITDNQIFPDEYKLYRKDRLTTEVGVLIAINKEYLSSPVPELSTDCEIVWAKISLANSQDLYIAAYYNPKTTNEQSLDELAISLNRACRNTNSNIIIAGDFNLPGWIWKTKNLKPNTPCPKNHHTFIDMLNDNGLAQMVEEPTRGENTLDLVISDNRSCITRVHTLPGISDHDIVFAEVDLKIKTKIQKPRSIPLYKKAKWDTMKEELAGLMDKLNELDNIKTCTNEMWCVFKNHLEEIVKKHVPHKIAKTKESLPWITPDIRKLIRKRDRLYKQNKKSGNTTTAKKFKDIKRKVQRELRRAYWNYIEEIVTPQENDNQYTNMNLQTVKASHHYEVMVSSTQTQLTNQAS
jgi:hypothetical protein